MSFSANSDDWSVRSILLPSLFSSSPGLAMLMLVAIGDLFLDGVPLLILVGCAVAGMFAADALLPRTAFGAAQRNEHQRMMGTLDAGESRVHNLARWLPIGVAFVAVVLTDETGSIALALVLAYCVAQLAFAVWLHGRRDELSPASTS